MKTKEFSQTKSSLYLFNINIYFLWHVGINNHACTLSCSYMTATGFTWSEAKQNIPFWFRKALALKEPEFFFSLYLCISNILHNSKCIQNSAEENNKAPLYMS